MTAQEAINFIENEIQIDVRFCSDETVSKTKEVLEFAISALEKQIPQKPNLQGDGYADGEFVYDYAECPVCGCDFEEESNCWGCKFCPGCGQALDWSDTE
jgi:hypothetical protein